jgi:hypothetical protein
MPENEITFNDYNNDKINNSNGNDYDELFMVVRFSVFTACEKKRKKEKRAE